VELETSRETAGMSYSERSSQPRRTGAKSVIGHVPLVEGHPYLRRGMSREGSVSHSSGGGHRSMIAPLSHSQRESSRPDAKASDKLNRDAPSLRAKRETPAVVRDVERSMDSTIEYDGDLSVGPFGRSNSSAETKLDGRSQGPNESPVDEPTMAVGSMVRRKEVRGSSTVEGRQGASWASSTEIYAPQNDSGRFSGSVTAREVLDQSLRAPVVALAFGIGLDNGAGR
jgi:hypothetical protein